MWDLPGPGHEPVSPALAGGFLTTAPPGKPQNAILDQSRFWGFFFGKLINFYWSIVDLKVVFFFKAS